MNPETRGTISVIDLEPYKGSDSYQIEDFELFFGREREAEQLTALILASSFSLLHAPSAAGKTSLLNARVIPFLESSRWLPVRTLLQNDPIQAIRTSVLRGVVMCPEAEVLAVDRILECCSAAVGPDTSIAQLLQFYDSLPVGDPRSRLLLMPVSSNLPIWSRGNGSAGRTVPFVSRLLRSTCDTARYDLFIRAVIPRFPAITADTRLGDLRAQLHAESCTSCYRDLIADLEPPVPNLVGFFEHLWMVMSRRLPPGEFAVVLILDQFEEIFTRYVDRSLEGTTESSLPDWRLRLELFDELRRLYESLKTQGQSEGASAVPTTGMPLRILISMRDEFIAQLDPIRQFVWNLDEASFHLDFIARKEAPTVIQEPARFYGYSYAPDCSSKIIEDLSREGRVVEPAHIQIICTKLWTVRESVIALQLYETLGGTRGILNSYFGEFLARFNPAEVLTIVEILEPLITSGGTRNIMEEVSLIHQPLRSPVERRRLLSELDKRNIIRVEPRLGGRFVEITHEFLIRPIQQHITQLLIQDPDYSRLRDAITALRALEHQDFRCLRSVSHLSRPQFDSLHAHREALEWTPWAREVMFRATIGLGADPEAARTWADSLRDDPVVLSDQDVFDLMRYRQPRGICLAAIEIQIVSDRHGRQKALAIDPFLVARSIIEESTDSRSEEVRTWFQDLVGG
jgi:hypothetical protein